MAKKEIKKEIDRELFSQARNSWILYIKSNIDEGYEFGSSSAVGEGENKKMANLEAMMFKNILKRLIYRVELKFPGIQGKELNEKVMQALQYILIFAHNNGYTVTAINIISKLNNIIQHIQNESRAKSNKDNGFDISSATQWLNGA